MNTNDAIWKNSMNYGAIIGMALIVYTVILYILNLTFNQALNWLSYGILIFGIVIGTKNLRDGIQNGIITYGRALGSGVLISVFAGIIVAFFIYVLYSIIDPDLLERSFVFMEEKFIEQGRFTDDQIEMIMARTRNTTPLKIALWTLPGYAFMGTILSLIISIFLKKEPGVFENQ